MGYYIKLNLHVSEDLKILFHIPCNNYPLYEHEHPAYAALGDMELASHRQQL